MKRFRSALRLALFPLLFACGATALVAGYLEWKRFFGDLYLEEMQAIEAAVAQGAEVEYRRAGEPRYRVASRTNGWTGQNVDPAWEQERTTVPDNAPFLGRVESVKFRDQTYNALQPLPTRDVRDGLLRLPGVKGFEGRCSPPVSSASDSPRSDGADALEQALGRPLPKLPEPTLTLEEAEAPIPRGEPLDASARAELAAKIAAAWKRKRPLKTYVAESAYSPSDAEEFTFVVTEIADGERFLSRVERPAIMDARTSHVAWGNSGPRLEPLRLFDDERASVFEEVGDGLRRIAVIDRTPGGETSDRKRFASALDSPEELPRLTVGGERFGYVQTLSLGEAEPIGENGSNVISIERVDDRRLRLELAPQSTKASDWTFASRVEMVVREDMEFAAERFVVRQEALTDRSDAGPTLISLVTRRLARTGDAIYAQETLHSNGSEPLPHPRDPRRRSANAERTLTTIVPLSEVPAAVFDPLSYDGAVWPEPRTLPTIRSYRTLWTLGAGLIAASVLGPLALRLRTRRRRRVGEATQETVAPAPLRLPRLRFGLAALFAAALAVISVAGAVKQTRDVVLRDVETLRWIDGGVEIERHEPSFPWSLASTPAFPIDAPLKRIAISAIRGETSPPVPKEVVRELLADPRLESFHDYSAQAAVQPKEYVLADAAAALGRSLPELPERIPPPETALWLESMPEGEPLAAAEQAAFVERLTSAWQKMAAGFPERYLLVESHDHYGPPEARATLRSGERCWSMGGKGSLFVGSQDERFRYRFGESDDGFSLVERTRIGSSALARPRDAWNYASAHRLETQRSPFRMELPGRAADPPFAFPRYLYDEIQNFDEVARAALHPGRVVRVSRLDDDRCRVDFEPTELQVAGNASDWGFEGSILGDWEDGRWTENSADIRISVKVAQLAVVVREDLDHVVERTFCDVRFYRRLEKPAGVARLPTRKLYVANRFVRAPEGIVVPESTRVGDDRGGNRTWWDSRFAYDLSPPIDERIFSSPSLADPEPYPVVERRWPITWPLFTGALSLLILAGLGAKRVARAVTLRRASAPEASRAAASTPE
ncbi:MAG TPA: hypothetical protein VGN57_18450 [Pirellulaceae bacterium]|nr:hypothetical protein [Pirellulaceae bacterium]